jgi:hypothetical protein
VAEKHRIHDGRRRIKMYQKATEIYLPCSEANKIIDNMTKTPTRKISMNITGYLVEYEKKNDIRDGVLCGSECKVKIVVDEVDVICEDKTSTSLLDIKQLTDDLLRHYNELKK